MTEPHIFDMSFARIHALYVAKAERLVDEVSREKKMASNLWA